MEVVTTGSLTCCSWNVKGLLLHMSHYSMGILCLQETHLSNTAVYEEGSLVILAGADGEHRSWAGVGFIIAPRCKGRVKSYKQVSDRMCSLRLKVAGGIVGVLTAYAPHNLKPLAERFQFVAELHMEYRKRSANALELESRRSAARRGWHHRHSHVWASCEP